MGEEGHPRGIKSSNVLLDSELNVRLRDFGLAQQYEHSENTRMTRVVGTLGYTALELTKTEKAMPSSYIFNFGVLLLEVASMRKPVDLPWTSNNIVWWAVSQCCMPMEIC